MLALVYLKLGVASLRVFIVVVSRVMFSNLRFSFLLLYELSSIRDGLD